MQQYHEIIQHIKNYGYDKGDRTKTGTRSSFGQQKRFPLHINYNPKLPTVTTKYVHLTSVEHELFWMLSGNTRLEYLIANGVRIWNEWVLKGTEVYRDMTIEELLKILDKDYCREATIVGGDGTWALDFLDDDTRSLKITGKAYRAATTIQDVQLIAEGRADELYHEHLKRIYRVVTNGKEPQILIGGDLGPVYGRTWRDIADTRIIDKGEWHKYEARGFKFVIDIPGEVFTEDKCVVTRRVDQIANLLADLQKEPEDDFSGKGNNRDSRRLLICAWDPRLVEDQALPPCHSLFQFFTRKLSLQERINIFNANTVRQEEDDRKDGMVIRSHPGPQTVEQFIKRLEMWSKEPVTEDDISKKMDSFHIPTRGISCQLYQRSGDTFLGVPFNITFYSLLTHMLANQFNMLAEEFIWTGGDTHIYSNHEEQTNLQLTRDFYDMPDIKFHNRGQGILEVGRDDYTISNYQYHPHIAGKVAV